MPIKKKLSAAFNKVSIAYYKFNDSITPATFLGMSAGLIAGLAIGATVLPGLGLLVGGALAGKFAVAKLAPNSRFNRHQVTQNKAQQSKKIVKHQPHQP